MGLDQIQSIFVEVTALAVIVIPLMLWFRRQFMRAVKDRQQDLQTMFEEERKERKKAQQTMHDESREQMQMYYDLLIITKDHIKDSTAQEAATALELQRAAAVVNVCQAVQEHKRLNP